MLTRITRRQCLTQLTAATAAAGIFGGPAAFAIEPIQRTGQAKFKLSLAAYSYRDLFKQGEATLSDFVRDCAKMGLDGTELTSYYFPKSPQPEYLRQLARECFQLGLDISGTAIGNDFCHPPGDTRDQQIALTKTWVDHAAILGAPVIRIFSGKAKSGMSKAEAHRLAIEGMQHCCEYAGSRGVHLALENHGGLTATADEMLELVQAVDSPWFGVNLDSGNFHSEDVYAELAKIAPYALNAQIKVVTSGPDRKKVPTDFDRLAKILKDAGYRGYIVLEYEEKGDPRKECPKYVEVLRKAFA